MYGLKCGRCHKKCGVWQPCALPAGPLGGRVSGVQAGDGNRVQAFLNQKQDSQESESESLN